MVPPVYCNTPNVEVRELSPDDSEGYADLKENFDTALLLKTLEYSVDPGACLRRVNECLAPAGRLVVSVPQGAGMNSLDRGMAYRQRFSKPQILSLLESNGFTVEQTRELNKVGRVAWGIFGGLFGNEKINKVSLKLFDKTVWLTKIFEPLLPWAGLNLIVIARKK